MMNRAKKPAAYLMAGAWLVACAGCAGGGSEGSDTTNADAKTAATRPSSSADVNSVGRPSSSAPEIPADECGEIPMGRSETTLTAGGATHAVRIYVPSAAGSSSDVLPTVLNWHGLGEPVDDIIGYTGFETLAEAEGFIVVHPTGALSPGLPVLETGLGWELVDALDTSDRDDIAFARALIDDLVANWCADPDRIYSVGFSNGGLFTSTLVCRLSDRLAAAASVAGVYHADTCRPSEPVPYIAFHGTKDYFVPYEAGGYATFPELRATLFTVGMFDAFAAFAAGAGCELDPVTSAIGDDVTRYDYRGCNGDTPMTFYAIEGDGHAWPGVSGWSTTQDIDATLAIWNFFARHSRSQDGADLPSASASDGTESG